MSSKIVQDTKINCEKIPTWQYSENEPIDYSKIVILFSKFAKEKKNMVKHSISKHTIKHNSPEYKAILIDEIKNSSKQR